MSHVENAESQNNIRRTSDVVASENDRPVAKVELVTSTNKEAHPFVFDNAASKFNSEADKERSDTKLQAKNETDKNDTSVASGDICRICHMSENALLAENNSSCDLQRRASTSSNLVHLGPLISACKCRGTVGLVHTECLERWLTESGRARCELCGFRYATKRIRRYNLLRSVLIWIQTVIASRQMLLDIGYLVMTTPVAAFSCYVCALALKVMLQNGFYEIPWMIVAILPTCLLTLIAYWRWIITLGRLHGNRWRRYWRNNFVVRLIPDNEGDAVELRRSDRFNTQDDFEQWRIEEIEEFV